MPVAMLPSPVVEATGAASPIVTVMYYAVAHNSTHATAAWEWARVQRLLDEGEIRRRERDGALEVFVPRGKGWWLVVLHETEGGYEVATMMRAPDRYVQKQREVSDELRKGAGGEVAEGRP